MNPVCEHCSNVIPRRSGEGTAQYAARRFCNRVCYDAVNRVDRPTAVCEQCGTVFGPTRHERPTQFRKRNPRYCSQTCNAAAKTRLAKRVIEVRRCGHCGDQVVAYSRSEASEAARHRFCSRDCYLDALKAGRPSKACPICAVEFGPSFGESRRVFANRIHCSRACTGEAKRRRYARTAPDCVGCGRTIEPGAGDTPARLSRRKFCSLPCRGAWRSRQPRAERKPRPVRPRKVVKPGPKPELSVFGDRKPVETWRPAGFASAPRTGSAS